MIQRKRLAVILSVGFILSVPSAIYLSAAWQGPPLTPTPNTPPNNNVGPLINGSGATGYMPRFTGALTVSNSTLTSDGVSATANGNFFVSGGRLYYGNANTRTETRDNPGTLGGTSGFYESSAPSPAANWYPGASSWQHLLEVRHSNTSNNYALQIAGSFFDQNLYFRKTNDSASTGWSKFVSEVNNSTIIGGGSSSNWATLNLGGAMSINAGGTIYSYSGICVGMNSGNCTGSGGTRINGTGVTFPDGTTQTTATSGGIGGSGAAGYVPRYTAASTLSNSSITSDGVSSTANGNFFTTGILQSTNGFRGDAAANFGGTGAAAYFPNGLWSNGANAWIYGQINTNGIISDTSSRMALNPAGNSYFNGGNVGIGTASPSYKLQVNGDVYANGGWVRVAGNNGLYWEGWGGGFYMQDTSWIRGYNGKGLWMGGGPIGTDGSLTVGYGGSGAAAGGAIIAGSVGIGTQSPGAKLEVSGNSTFGSENGPIMVTSASVPSKKVSIGYDNSIDAGYISSLHSGVAWKNLILQGSAGFVGIGKTNPGYTLDVSGDINTTGCFRVNGTCLSSGSIAGSGTAGYISRFTPNGTTLGNSTISDDGASATANGNFYVAGNEGVNGGLTVGTAGVTNNTNGSLSIGHQGINYTPTGSNWTTSGSTLLLNGQDYSTIGFHDSGLRVDYIRAGAGTIQLGYNAGWGEANIGMPGGGVWNNSGNVGIGTTNPGAALDVNGNIGLPSSTGNKSIYTWANSDTNWRIGMSINPGFTRALATSHVEYATFASGPNQGFAVGDASSGLSAFEVTGAGSGYNAYFRGNVGIGTASPGAKLDVNGGIKLSGSLTGADLISESSGGATTSLTPGSLALVSQYGAVMTMSGGRLDMSDGGSISSYYNWNGFHTGGVTNASNYADGADGQLIALNYNANGKAIYGAGYGAQGYGIYCAVGYCGSAGASWTTTSDGRLKENIKTIASGLDKILNLRGVYYTWKDHRMTGNQIGFIAQEVLPIVPEAVTKNANGEYTMSYERIVPVLVEAVKDLNKKNDDLKAQNDKLEARLSALEAKLK